MFMVRYLRKAVHYFVVSDCHPRFSKYNPSNCSTIERRRKKDGGNSSSTKMRLQVRVLVGGGEPTMPVKSSFFSSALVHLPGSGDPRAPGEEKSSFIPANFYSMLPPSSGIEVDPGSQVRTLHPSPSSSTGSEFPGDRFTITFDH
jgi:hypothetical protein